MRPHPLAAAALGAAALAPAAHARPIADCVPAARAAALDAVGRTPAIGQMSVFGSPLAIEPRKLRLEVDVFGPQSLVYRADVTLDNACNVLATNIVLENNPWYRW